MCDLERLRNLVLAPPDWQIGDAFLSVKPGGGVRKLKQSTPGRHASLHILQNSDLVQSILGSVGKKIGLRGSGGGGWGVQITATIAAVVPKPILPKTQKEADGPA